MLRAGSTILLGVTAAAGAPKPMETDAPARVLWLIKGLGAGGAERLLALSARLRDRDAVEPQIAYLLEHKRALIDEFAAAGVPTTCLRARGSWDLRWIRGLRHLCRSERIAIVHSHSPITTIGARIALRTMPRSVRPALVTTEHNVWGSHARATRLADAATARGEELHLAVSGAVRESMPARLREGTRLVQYGVPVAEVREIGRDREGARRALGVGPGEVLVGTVANLRATKGYPDLLAAARLVVDRADDVLFVALGQGPLEAELRARADELGLGTRFRFLGYRADAVEVMSAFDVFCLASHYEGLPIALMEALVLGIPVVATDVGGIAEVVTDGQEAILVTPGRPQELADAIVALAADPERRAEMSRRARERGERLDIEHAVRTVEAVYREVLGR